MPAGITQVAVLGTGTIGASWAANFLAQGLSVAASDPAPGAEAFLKTFIDNAWPTLEALGLAAGADPSRLSFAQNPLEAVEGAQFVQENGPERIEVKVALFDQVSRALPPDAIIASSSSTLLPTAMQARCIHPERLLLGHPFNPPHLIPLVEVCGGEKTSPEAIDRATAFYKAIGKHPIRLNKEMPGHVSNRLQSALWREAAYLVEQGVVDVADADAAVAMGPGLRWALMGPILTFHLGGGAGGLGYLMDHIDVSKLWPTLGTPAMTPEFKQTLIDGVNQEANHRPIPELAATRDRRLLALLKAISQ
jgi:3-hydroxyacyl-CoA dehydrogenase